MQNTTVVAKNKRGRPKKVKVPSAAPLGRQDEPSGIPELGSDNGVELVHTSYNGVKCIVNLAQKMKSEKIHFLFTPYSASILCVDKHMSIKMLCSFNLSKMYRYYCSATDSTDGVYMITLNVNNLHRVMSGLKKAADNLKYFALTVPMTPMIQDGALTKVCTSVGVFIMYNDGRMSSDRLDIARGCPEDVWDTMVELRSNIDDYSLKCVMSNSVFKDLINSAAKVATNIMFEKTSAESKLICTYNYKNNCGNKIVDYGESVDVEHDGEMVGVSVNVTNIKTLGKLIIAEYVTLHLDNNNPLVLRASVDGEIDVVISC